MLRLIVVAVILAGFVPSSRAGVAYTDGFEGPNLNPFWTPSISRGSLSFTPAGAHSGTNGAQFDTTSDSSGQKTVQLTHAFGQPTFGNFSVWVYDTAAGEPSTNYFRFFASPTPVPANGWGAQILTHDEPPDPNYTVMGFTSNEIASTVARTKGWHHWEIDDQPTGLNLLIDGQTVLSSPNVQPISNVVLMMTAPGFRPGWTGYYDDFQFTPVPEPGTAGTIACIGALCALRRRRWA